VWMVVECIVEELGMLVGELVGWSVCFIDCISV